MIYRVFTTNIIFYFLCLSIILSKSIYSQESQCSVSISHNRVNEGVIGLPIQISASISRPSEYIWARLHVKKSFESNFLSIPCQGAGGYFTCQIPARYTIKEGTDYYIEVLQQNRARCYFPNNAPNRFINFLNAERSSKIQIQYFSPERKLVDSAIPNLYATILGLDYFDEKESIVVTLDNREIPFVKEYNNIKYTGTKPLSTGIHSFKIQIFDKRGILIAQNVREFEVDYEADPEKRIKKIKEKIEKGEDVEPEAESKWQVTGGLKFNINVAGTQGNQDNVAYPNGYLSFSSNIQIKSEDYNIFIGPFNLPKVSLETFRFDNQEVYNTIPGERRNQVNFGLQYKNFNIKAGSSVSSAAGSLAGVNLSYKGKAFKDKLNYNIEGFVGQNTIPTEGVTQTINESQNILQSAVFSQLAYGSSLGFSFYGVSLNFKYNELRDDFNSIENNLGEEYNQLNRNFDFSSSFNIPAGYVIQSIKFSISGSQSRVFSYTLPSGSTTTPTTVALTNYNISNDGLGLNVKGGLNGNIEKINTGFSLDVGWSSPSFLSLSESRYGDRLKINSNFNHTILNGQISISESFSYDMDNIAGEKNNTTIGLVGSINLNINIDKWPSISISDSINSNVILGDNEIPRSLSNNLTISLSRSFNAKVKERSISVSANINYNQNHTIEIQNPRSSGSVETDNSNQQGQYTLSTSPSFTFDLLPPYWPNITFSYSFSMTLSGLEVNSISESISFNTTIANLWKLSFPISLSYNRNTNDYRLPGNAQSISFQISTSLSLNKHNLSVNFSIQHSFGSPERSSTQYSGGISYSVSF